jgi:hypothetical protein
MQGSNARIRVVVNGIAAEAYQVFFGAMTSLQLGAPGIGDRASWAPNVLVAEAFTVLPLGFLLSLWGAPIGRTIATVCAVAMVVVGLAAAATLARSPAEFLVFFAMLAPPWIALLLSVRRMQRAAAASGAANVDA